LSNDRILVIIEQYEKKIRSSLSILNSFDKAKKSSHAILSLSFNTATSAAPQKFLVSKDAGTEGRTVVVLILTVRAANISRL
jgi:hypothetical protein